MDAGNKEERLPNPRANANIIEIFTFSWILNLFKIGRKRDFEINDLYLTLDEHTSSSLGDDLEKRWRTELAKASKMNQKPSLLRVLIQMIAAKFMIYGMIHTFVELVIRMFQPMLIGGLLRYFNQNESNNTNLRYAYMYASGLILSMLVNILLFHYSQMEISHCGMKVRVACCSIIFKKALRLSKTSLNETTVGQVVNLLSNDVNRFDMAFKFLQYLWIGPIATIVVTYFLWQEIGVSSLLGIAGLLVFVPLQGWLGKKASEFRIKTAHKTDERVRLMDEIISGIQIIKMYTWEKPFANLVQYARKMEIQQIRGASYIRIIITSFKIFHTRFALFLSILSYVLLGNFINAQKVYVIISYFSILMTTMTIFFPQSITLSAEMLISIKRIEEFLLCDEKDKQIESFSELGNISNNSIQMENICSKGLVTNNTNNQKDIEQLNNCGITVLNATAKWISSQSNNSLENINLMVIPGRLVAIIGPVGAGKSSLIQAILRELPLLKGKISIRGVVSYASQEPWLFNSSIQQNILFGSPMDNERYKQVIKVCALKTDFEQFPYGDKTIVGERGISLSGGQRARINLARAVYKKADIYLLDDPLSAVDSHVGKHLFEKCIKGYLKEKTCILITHQIQYLTSVDQIVLMENANILAEGSYQELQSSGLDFTKLLQSAEEPSVTSDIESDNKYITNSSVDPIPVLSRQGSIQSVSSSIDENKFSGTEVVPIEVAEIRSSGNVPKSVYFSYISAGGNICKISFLILICIFAQILCTGGDFWISYWVNLEDYTFRNKVNESENNTPMINESSDILLWWPVSRQMCVIVYSVLNVTMLIAILIRCVICISFFMGVSLNLHNNMFNAITRAKMYFFNTNSSGRILNRFTKDMGAIDELLILPVTDFLYIMMSSIGVLFVVGLINIYFMIPTFIVGVLFYYISNFYLSTSRSIKRLEGISKSPVIAHLNASLQGLTTIRAFEAEEILSKEFDNHQDLHSSAWYLFISSSEAFGFTLDIACIIYILFLTIGFLVIGNDSLGGNVGLVITQAINLTGSLQWGIRQTAELENHMTSVERVLEYTNIPQEAALESVPDKKPPKEWPDKGKIVFQKFNLRYSLDTPFVLKNLNIRIQPMEKIGIVGRTGAGKSSLIGALFRLAFNEGYIYIDDIEIHELGLHELRSKISIIPQEPVLFSGTMRKNLDPFDEYPDHILWNALDEVELKHIVEDLPDGLNSKMSVGGSNFSVGQRQLVCLARAIVRCNKFIVLDEATANVDSQTDALIQNTIRNKFKTCTVLTIAHRLNTVMDSDKVLVMDAGTMVEFDHPHSLLQNKDGVLYNMVEQTEQTTADLLKGIAVESYNRIMQTTRESQIKLIDEEADNNSIKNASLYLI